MLIGKVVGTVVSTRKEDRLEGLRFMVIREVGPDGTLTGKSVVAADAVGAGVNEWVLYATGSAARQTVFTKYRPVDAVIMAIVDEVEVGGEQTYVKFVND